MNRFGWKLLQINIAALLLVGVAPVLTAQVMGTVAVRVVQDSSQPLPAATVSSGAQSARTDGTGQALLRLPPGNHTVVAIRVGFASDSDRVTVRADSVTTVVLMLRAQAATLSDVIIVGATRSGRRIEDEPVRVEVLVREEVEEKLLMTPGDITMMLNETSGLRVQTTSPSLGGANVRIQGLRGRYTQILSDGLPLFGGQTGGLGLLQIPPMDLGGVEIIKGVASALYGSSALGGVVNLLSRRPGDDPIGELMFNQTTLGGTDVVSFLATRANPDGLAYTLLAGGHLQRQVDRDSDGWTDLPSYERVVVRPRVFWEGDGGHRAMLTAGFTGEDRSGGSMPGSLAPDNSPFPENLRTRRFDAGAIGSVALGLEGTLNLRGSLSEQRHEHTFGPVLEEDRHNTWFGEAAWTWSRNTSSIVLGAALQNERYSSREFSQFNYSTTTPGAFAQGTFEPAEWLSLSASARYDDHSEYGAFLSPRLSLLVRATDSWSIRLSGGSGYFAPTPFTEETEVTGLAVLEPLTDIEAERVFSGSLDAGGSIGPLELNATIFASRLRDPIAVRAAGGDESRAELVNVPGSTNTAGAELLLRWHPEPFHVSASYTFVNSREADPVTGARREVALTPRHQAGVVTALEIEGSWRAGVEIYYTGRQALWDDAYRSASKPYVHVGVLAERRMGRARLFVNAENLLDYRQTSYDPLVRPSRGLGGRWTNDVWAPLDGFVANMGVRFDLY